jgi:diguanylate cyclase (GGDEF)-like protein
VAHQAIEQRAVVWVSDLAADPGHSLGQQARALPIRSVVAVPGLAGEEVLALTYAFRAGADARPFDQHDVRLAVAISHHAAQTIQRARLVDQASQSERPAALDEVTGLPNRARLFELGEAELVRARRYRRPLAAMQVSIEGFQQLSERYGKAASNQALQAVAERCRRNMRERHLLGVYGGGTLVGLLLEAGRLEAELVAERLRRRMAEAPVETAAGPVKVSISTGCAALSDDCPSLAALVGQAEVALLQAKRTRVEGA